MRVSLVENDASQGASSRLMRAFALAISCSIFIFSAYAQSDRGTITGSVTDPSSAVVAGAKVEVRNLDNGSIYKAASTNTGGFTITSVPSGKYSVTVIRGRLQDGHRNRHRGASRSDGQDRFDAPSRPNFGHGHRDRGRRNAQDRQRRAEHERQRARKSTTSRSTSAAAARPAAASATG